MRSRVKGMGVVSLPWLAAVYHMLIARIYAVVSKRVEYGGFIDLFFVIYLFHALRGVRATEGEFSL
jgi:hypothetical protein